MQWGGETEREAMHGCLGFLRSHFPQFLPVRKTNSCSAYRLPSLIIWVIKHSSGILREWAWKLIFIQCDKKIIPCTWRTQSVLFLIQNFRLISSVTGMTKLCFSTGGPLCFFLNMRLTWATTSRFLFFFSPSVLGIHRKKTNCYEVTLPQELGFKEISRFWH